MRSGLAPAPSHPERIESLRCPKEERNSSRVMLRPSFAMVSRQEIQWSSSESTRVPSMSQSTARVIFISGPHGHLVASADLLRHLRECKVFQVAGVTVELADALRQLFGGHGVLVVHPTKCFFVEVQPLFLASLRRDRIEFTLEYPCGLFQLFEQLGTDREQIRSSEVHDLIHIAKAGPHHLRLIAEFFVVIVNACDGSDARILIRRNLGTAMLFLIPIVDAANEGRNQRYFGFGARDRLGEAEQKRQIAVDAFFLENLSCPNTLPGAGDLDENAFACHALLIIQ